MKVAGGQGNLQLQMTYVALLCMGDAVPVKLQKTKCFSAIVLIKVTWIEKQSQNILPSAEVAQVIGLLKSLATV